MEKREIELYHSADADDAFMVWALKTGAVDSGLLAFRMRSGDTEELNNLALQGVADIVAVSLATYGRIADRYLLFPHSGSVGRNYGPVIVSRRAYPLDDLRGLRIATPGETTTAHCVLRMMAPLAVTVTIPIVPFERVFDALEQGEVDAAMLIHEGRLLYASRGYHLVADIGAWWYKRTGLPLPLGGTVIKKSLGEQTICAASSCLRASIRYALEHREEVIEGILAEAPIKTKQEVNKDLVDRYLALYANEDTLDYGEEGRAAIRTFLDLSFHAGLLPKKVEAEFTL
jgi:1,4-dihydroxy-6-naphthoate synthase